MADIIGDIVRVTVAAYYDTKTQLQINALHFICKATGGGDTRNALGVAVFNNYSAQLLAGMPATSSLYGYKVDNVNRTPPPVPITANLEVPGMGSGVPMPSQCRPLVALKTAFAGRGYRGRIFTFTPVSSKINADGTVLAAWVTTMDAFTDALIAPQAVGGSTWQLCIAHRPKGPILAWSATDVNEGGSTTLIATQRSSGRYGRINQYPPW